MADTQKMVTVEALKLHTYNGKTYNVGDTYEFPDEHADGLVVGGFAVRVDRVAHAKQAATPAPAAKAKTSTKR